MKLGTNIEISSNGAIDYSPGRKLRVAVEKIKTSAVSATYRNIKIL